MQVTSSDFGDMSIVLDFNLQLFPHARVLRPVSNFEAIASKILYLAFVAMKSTAECNFLAN